ncbi:MAG: exodeoxyribonuclease VII small subunit [Pseudomonadota bacterium]
MATKKLSVNLEKSLKDLETIVTTLEQGELSLEDALKQFEKGVALTRQCQKALTEAEQKVDMLVGDKVVPFTDADRGDEPE